MFKECLKYPNQFQSTLPAKLGLPEIEDNICEGIIIKPVEPKFLFDHSRVILKNKNERFTEVQKESKPKTVIPELSLEAQRALDVMSSYVTQNRLKNVLSKLGSVTQQDFGKVMGAMNQDLTEDFLKDHEGLLNVLEKPERKRVTKQVYGQAAQLIRSNFLNIVDGEF